MVLYHYHVVVVRCKDIEQEIQMVHLKLNRNKQTFLFFYSIVLQFQAEFKPLENNKLNIAKMRTLKGTVTFSMGYTPLR